MSASPSPRHATSSLRTLRGATLLELIVFMLIVGVAAGAILALYASATKRSSTPLVEKQALAIAESLMEEIRLMPFSFCDPDDANVSTATGAFVGLNGCAATVEAMGPEAGETRYAALTPFDNVNDYNGFSMPGAGCAAGICDIRGIPIPELAAYTAVVSVVPYAFADPAIAALRVTVTVTGPGNIRAVLDGVRTRHAPNL